MKLLCSCGGGNLGANHTLGEGECYRKLAVGDLIPKNFRTENGTKVCDVNGHTITEFTLRQQRLYAEKENGQWSLPKDESSINSLPDET